MKSQSVTVELLVVVAMVAVCIWITLRMILGG